MTASSVPASAGASRPRSVTASLLPLWRQLQRYPGGSRLFSIALGRMARYTGSIHPHVVELAPGRATVVMKDRASVRNHLRSIHAIALANLAEAASGLAVIAALPEDVRGILVGFRVEYLKKARGTLTARCVADVPPVSGTAVDEPEVVITDEAGDVVVRAWPKWRLGLVPR